MSLASKPQDEASIAGLTYASLDKKEVRGTVERSDIVVTVVTLALVLGMYLYFSFWL